MSSPIKYPPGFRTRRGLNWVILGAMYASFYMLRYNFRWAAPGIEHDFGFSHASIAKILSASYLAYGTGQLINGLKNAGVTLDRKSLSELAISNPAAFATLAAQAKAAAKTSAGASQPSVTSRPSTVGSAESAAPPPD